MAIRLQEVHPALVHVPLALFPVSIVADTLATLLDNKSLFELGRMTMPIATAGAAAAGVAGLVAQEAIHAEGEAYDYLVTHRTLNVAALGITSLMTLYRMSRKRPGRGYLAAGMGLLGALGYSAYLGSKLVYWRGVGVIPADGLREERAPELRFRNVGQVGRAVGANLRDGVKHVVRDFGDGRVVPVLRRDMMRMRGNGHARTMPDEASMGESPMGEEVGGRRGSASRFDLEESSPRPGEPGHIPILRPGHESPEAE